MDLDPQVLLDLATVLPLLRCPASGAKLRLESEDELQSADGRHRYPILDGVPALIDPDQSLFDPRSSPESDDEEAPSTLGGRAGEAGWKVAKRVVPDISRSTSVPNGTSAASAS